MSAHGGTLDAWPRARRFVGKSARQNGGSARIRRLVAAAREAPVPGADDGADRGAAKAPPRCALPPGSARRYAEAVMLRRAACSLIALSCACANGRAAPARPAAREDAALASRGASTDQARARERMVRAQLAARGIADPRVLEAMRKVPRHAFVPEDVRALAYDDHPLPIGHEQTISQPYIVAAMTELARLKPSDQVLEIGTGSGYQAAVLASLVRAVYSIEIVEPLARRARETLARLGYRNVEVRAGDGYQGWPERAPFDAILVTAAPPKVPEPLKRQLAIGGRLVIPVGEQFQELRVLTRRERGFDERVALPVRFVPMTGRAQAP